MPDDPVTAELDRIAADARSLAQTRTPSWGTVPKIQRVIGGTERTLAALRAVLELADGWNAEAERAADRADDAHENGEDGSFHMHSTRCVTLDYCLTEVREVITREITGKGESDER